MMAILPPPRSLRLVIIGAGMASTRLVRELTTLAPGHYAITVIGDEPHAAYNRVLLSSVLAGETGANDITLEPDEWWTERNITRVHGSGVISIDASNRSLSLTDGRRVPYDKLVIATGSEAVRLPLPGVNLPGVLTFRTLGDVDQLLARASTGCRAVVIGGGLLGLEAAYGMSKAGANVAVVHVMDRLMERQLDKVAASMLLEELSGRGIAVHLESQSTSIIGQDRAEGLVLSSGLVLAADLIVMAVGIRPAVRLAMDAGLAVKRGVQVDDHLATSDPNIFSIGECAEHRGHCYGLVEPAYEQAKILAQCLIGQKARYEGSLIATNLKVSGVHLFSAGNHMGGAGTEPIILRDRGLHIYKKLVLRRTDHGTILEGCVLYGNTVDGLWYLDMMRHRTPVDRFRHDLVFGRSYVQALAA